MVKIIGPVMSFGGFQPLRKPRKYYPPTGGSDVVTVTAGTPPPSPDCTGTYVYFENHNGEHAYRRTTTPNFYIFWDVMRTMWTIALQIIDEECEDIWVKDTPINGAYIPQSPYTGQPIASEPS